MAETLVVGTRGDWTSLVVNCYIAINLKRIGHDVALAFDSDALQAIGEGKFEPSAFDARIWPMFLENAKKMGFPEGGPLEWIKMVKAAGIHIYTCGGQVDMRGLRGKLPPEIEPLYPDLLNVLAEAKKVIGGW